MGKDLYMSFDRRPSFGRWLCPIALRFCTSLILLSSPHGWTSNVAVVLLKLVSSPFQRPARKIRSGCSAMILRILGGIYSLCQRDRLPRLRPLPPCKTMHIPITLSPKSDLFHRRYVKSALSSCCQDPLPCTLSWNRDWIGLVFSFHCKNYWINGASVVV
jgi:hypothetical protein